MLPQNETLFNKLNILLQQFFFQIFSFSRFSIWGFSQVLGILTFVVSHIQLAERSIIVIIKITVENLTENKHATIRSVRWRRM